MVTGLPTMRSMLLDRFEKYGGRTLLILPKEEKSLTYNDMSSMTAVAAHVLDRFRLQKGDYVAIALGNSPELIALLFASLVSGVRMVLLGPDYSLEEIAELHRDIGLKGLFLDADNLPGSGTMDIATDLPCMFVRPGCYDHDSYSNVPVPVKTEVDIIADDTAYIMCSSGSTGAPKRICISHRNMLSELDSMVTAYGLSEQDRHLCILPLYHASGLFRNMLMPFYQGATIVFTEAFNQETFWGHVSKYEIGFVQAVPSVLSLLVNQKSGPEPGNLRHLQYIGTASAPLPSDLQEQFESRFGVPVVQGYGLTESTCGITLNEIDPGKRRPGSVGRPLDVNTVAIMNDQGDIMPAGAEGEVVVRGENIMAGYLGSDGEPITPYTDQWFHTNDLGYLDNDGYVFLTGRKSDIINRGGHKVSPIEVEDVIHRHPAVRDALVISVPHSMLGEDVIAYVVKANKADINSVELLRYTDLHLPYYKVPSAIRFIDEIPRSASGKINRKAFAENVDAAMQKEIPAANRELGGTMEDHQHHFPSTVVDGISVESKVSEIVANVFNLSSEDVTGDLGPDNVDAWDSMGHIRLVLVIEEAYGIGISPEESATIKQVSDITRLVSTYSENPVALTASRNDIDRYV